MESVRIKKKRKKGILPEARSWSEAFDGILRRGKRGGRSRLESGRSY